LFKIRGYRYQLWTFCAFPLFDLQARADRRRTRRNAAS